VRVISLQQVKRLWRK